MSDTADRGGPRSSSGRHNRFPDFLIVGAMKAATTTLYKDLGSHPNVFFPADKEPEDLTREEVTTASGASAYARLFRMAAAEQVLGEASTAYTKRPDFDGVAERARTLLGPHLRVVYLVRDPVDRIVSHFWHDWAEGKVSGAIDDVVLRESRFVDYSRYAYQIEPWIREFGPKNVLILRFEEYVASRAMTLERTLEFLGVPRLARPEIDERVRENARDERRVTTRTLVGSLARSRTDRASKGAPVAGSEVGW